MNKKPLYLITGAASIVLGILCGCDRKLAVLLCGIGLFIYGVGELLHWHERRKAGAASVWALAGAFLAIAFGILILAGNSIGQSAARFLLISLSIWLMAQGVLEALGAIMYRKAMTTEDLGVQAPGSGAAMVTGVIMVVLGILGLISPVFAGYSVWIWIVLELIVSGVRLILRARSTGILEGHN